MAAVKEATGRNLLFRYDFCAGTVTAPLVLRSVRLSHLDTFPCIWERWW